MKKLIPIFILLFALLNNPAHAFVIINEIFADPPVGLAGDANNDGVRSATQDEFVELLNDGSTVVDISGWRISDATSTRHVFSSNTMLLPYEYIVVFSGGNPNLYDIKWQKASTGALNLNNTNETVTLFNSSLQTIDQVSYTTLANNDQSIVRVPEMAGGNFVYHTAATSNNADLFSPGTSIHGEPISQVIAVPEWPVHLYFLLAMLGWALTNRRSCLRLSRLGALTISNCSLYFKHSNLFNISGRSNHA